MKENSIFDINRVKLLLIRQLRFNTQTLLYGFGTVVGIIVLILSLKMIFGDATLDSGTFFQRIMPFFFIGGFIFTSTIFSELGTPQRGYMYLIIPASTFEKLVVSWFVTSILYIAASLVVILLINLLLIAIFSILPLNHVQLFNLFSPTMLKSYGVYLVTQSIFILGAIYFEKSHFLKTILSIFLICLAIAIYTSIAAKIIILNLTSSFQFNNSNIPENLSNFFVNIFAPTMKILFWGCLAPFFLIVSYFRLKEREI